MPAQLCPLLLSQQPVQPPRRSERMLPSLAAAPQAAKGAGWAEQLSRKQPKNQQGLGILGSDRGRANGPRQLVPPLQRGWLGALQQRHHQRVGQGGVRQLAANPAQTRRGAGQRGREHRSQQGRLQLQAQQTQHRQQLTALCSPHPPPCLKLQALQRRRLQPQGMAKRCREVTPSTRRPRHRSSGSLCGLGWGPRASWQRGSGRRWLSAPWPASCSARVRMSSRSTRRPLCEACSVQGTCCAVADTLQQVPGWNTNRLLHRACIWLLLMVPSSLSTSAHCKLACIPQPAVGTGLPASMLDMHGQGVHMSSGSASTAQFAGSAGSPALQVLPVPRPKHNLVGLNTKSWTKQDGDQACCIAAVIPASESACGG